MTNTLFVLILLVLVRTLLISIKDRYILFRVSEISFVLETFIHKRSLNMPQQIVHPLLKIKKNKFLYNYYNNISVVL